jgi:hypothetical protein
MATQAERNARLDELQQAVTDYATSARRNLTNRVAINKRILQGRTGSERLAQSSVEASSDIVVDEINDFLTGE